MSKIVTDPMPGSIQPNDLIVILKGLVGAILGGVIGYFLFVKLSEMGLYAFVLPGALIGIGCGWLAKSRSVILMVVCFLLAIAVATFGEWKSHWFVDDQGNNLGLVYFIQHIHESRNGFAIFAVGLNGIVAAWLSKRD